MGTGLLTFPVTDFDVRGDFDAASYRARLEWLAPYGASALFAAGGTGEFFSLEPREYGDIVRCAVEGSRGTVPILAGCGGPTRLAIAYAQEAERLGGTGKVVTVMGRFWALDREYNWDRIEKTYSALAEGVGTGIPG